MDVGKGMIIALQGPRQMGEWAGGQEVIGTMDRT